MHIYTHCYYTGIKIILDYVPNHTSDKHEWFTKSEAREPGYEDFYIWHDGRASPDGGPNIEPNNWVSVFYGSAWTWSDKRRQYYLHQFTKQQPDLNYRNPKVMERMSDVLRFWLAKGVSGFRVDAVCEHEDVSSFKSCNIPSPNLRLITCSRWRTLSMSR
jgi:alpha-glucosidase